MYYSALLSSEAIHNTANSDPNIQLSNVYCHFAYHKVGELKQEEYDCDGSPCKKNCSMFCITERLILPIDPWVLVCWRALFLLYLHKGDQFLLLYVVSTYIVCIYAVHDQVASIHVACRCFLFKYANTLITAFRCPSCGLLINLSTVVWL